ILSGCAEPDSFAPELPGQAQRTPIALEAAVAPTNFWASKAPMPTARSSLAAGVVNGLLYAVGGHDGTNSALTTVEAYNPSTNTWTTKAPLPQALSFGNGAGTINGVLYVPAGATLYAYTPSKNAWTTKAPRPA